MARSKVPATRIERVQIEPLDIPLREPFAIATGSVTSARNALVRVTLADGSSGLGEAAPFPPSGGETQETALAALAGMVPLVEGYDAAAWRPLAHRLTASFEHQATARAAMEVAVLDALTRSLGVPLFQFLGGAETQIETDITIPITDAAHMAQLAAGYAARGARTLKLKVGTQVDADVERVLAVATGAPGCQLILDGNQGFSPADALRLISDVPVAADESVHSAADALRVARLGAASAVNIKLMKSGMVEALEIAAVCRAAGLELMVGGMIESRLGIAASAHLIAGLGGFRYVDLDTPMLLADDPFTGGYTQTNMTYLLDASRAGLGVERG